MSEAELEGSHIVYSMQEIYGDFAITGLTATPELLARDPELARNVVCGAELALDYARQQPDASLKILQQRFPEVKPEIAKSALSASWKLESSQKDVTSAIRLGQGNHPQDGGR